MIFIEKTEKVQPSLPIEFFTHPLVNSTSFSFQSQKQGVCCSLYIQRCN